MSCISYNVAQNRHSVVDAVQTVMCPAINVVFLSWVHFLMHGGIAGTLLPFVSGSLPALLLANWKVRRRLCLSQGHVHKGCITA